MKSIAREWYRNQQFNPGIAGAFINPFFLARLALHGSMKSMAGMLQGRLLDVGCGTKPYRKLFRVSAYVGLDIDSPVTRRRGVADMLYDGTHFPFDSASFDSILCNQVLEHVFNPEQFIGEIHRVLSPGGRLLLTVPFVWDEHEQPWDYARYSSFGLRALLEKHGFKILRQEKLLADSSVLFQLLNTYIYKITRSRSLVLCFALTPLLMGPVSLLGWIFGRLLPRNPDLFLDQLVIAEK